MDKKIIALRRGLLIRPPFVSDKGAEIIVASLQSELMNLGYILDATVFDAICHTSKDWITDYYNGVIPYLSKTLGDSRQYTPFYRNFPAQVMDLSHYELFLNAIIHYWSNGTWEPNQEVKDRGFAFENVEFKQIHLGTEEDFKNIFTRLVSGHQSLTQDDKDTIDWFVDNEKDIELPTSIPFKETLCHLAAKGLNVPVKTPTDVLRIAVHLSGGDISLPHMPKVTRTKPFGGRMSYFYDTLKTQREEQRASFKFKKFNRKTRKQLLSFLEKTNPDAAEMQRHLGRWLRLGEILHPREYASVFPKSAEAFSLLRNQPPKVRTFNSLVNSAFTGTYPHAGIELLSQRPGEFARRLDWLLRTFTNSTSDILGTFENISGQISSKVMFELWNHFHGRTKSDTVRSIIIKGKKAKQKVLEPLPPMDAELVSLVNNTIITSITKKFAQLPFLGKVWIDDRLKDVPVPFAMRSVNTAIKTYVRGTKIPFSETAKVIRPFVHWYDKDGTEDLDLSLGIYDEDFKVVEHISWTNLKSPILGCCHSGDIRHRQGACAEYVDIPIETCLKRGCRYGLVQVHNFNGRAMHSVKDTVFGLMEREFPESNKIFVPKTISNCMGLANESSSVMVCILDFKEKCYIWADIETERALPTFESTQSKGMDVLRSLVNHSKMSVYDLLMMHVNARGDLVKEKSEASICMNWEDFVTDYSKVLEHMNFAPSKNAVPEKQLVS